VLAKRGWQLVQDENAFAEAICAEIYQRAMGDGDQTRVAIERATIRHYCIVLHAACSEPGSPRQRRAFEELWQYLYPIGLYKTHDTNLAQDLTQQALIKVWRNLSRCRAPGSFLNYATLVLLNETREYYRGKGRRREMFGEANRSEREITERDMRRSDDAEGHLESNTLGKAPRDEGLDLAITEETQRELSALIRECVRNAQQQRVLIELFFNDKGYREIAEKLGITVGNVHVLRHRALSALRKCDAFARFVEDELQ
jgi:RNA polymerase sigma factor (sigma-70 family)